MALTTTQINPNATFAGGGLEGAATNVLTAVFWNRLMNLLYAHLGIAGYIGCRANSSVSQSVGNNSVTALTLGAESFDSDPNGAMHDNSTNPTRITFRTAGVYHCGADIRPAANVTGFRQSYIRINGGSVIAFDTRMASTSAGAGSEVSLYCAYPFAVNDYIELVVQQASGGSLNYDSAMSAIKA